VTTAKIESDLSSASDIAGKRFRSSKAKYGRHGHWSVRRKNQTV